MLGDHLYRSTGDRNCSQQLLETFNQHGVSVLGLRQTPESDIANFGAATGIWISQPALLSVTEFAEKPTVDYARSNLRTAGISEGEYLTVFGEYIIKPQIFDYLEEHINNNLREHGEFQLTSALDRLRQEDGFMGLIIEGQRFDIGRPDHYLETITKFN